MSAKKYLFLFFFKIKKEINFLLSYIKIEGTFALSVFSNIDWRCNMKFFSRKDCHYDYTRIHTSHHTIHNTINQRRLILLKKENT